MILSRQTTFFHLSHISQPSLNQASEMSTQIKINKYILFQPIPPACPSLLDCTTTLQHISHFWFCVIVRLADPSSRPLMKMANRSGPSTDLQGTPLVTGLQVHPRPLTTTFWAQPFSQLVTHLAVRTPSPNINLLSLRIYRGHVKGLTEVQARKRSKKVIKTNNDGTAYLIYNKDYETLRELQHRALGQPMKTQISSSLSMLNHTVQPWRSCTACSQIPINAHGLYQVLSVMKAQLKEIK